MASKQSFLSEGGSKTWQLRVGCEGSLEEELGLLGIGRGGPCVREEYGSRPLQGEVGMERRHGKR